MNKEEQNLNNIEKPKFGIFTIEEYFNDFLPWMINNDYSIYPTKDHKNFNMSTEEIIKKYKNR